MKLQYTEYTGKLGKWTFLSQATGGRVLEEREIYNHANRYNLHVALHNFSAFQTLTPTLQEIIFEMLCHML